MVSRITYLHGIAGKTHQALSDAFCPTVCPRCTTFFFFFCGPVMLTACLGELSTLCRYGRKVQSLEDRSQAQKVFVLLLARCKGWVWLESSSGSHTAWAECEQVGCTWHRGVLCSLRVAVSCWASQFSSGCFLLQHSCWTNNLHQCPVKWISPAYIMLKCSFLEVLMIFKYACSRKVN